VKAVERRNCLLNTKKQQKQMQRQKVLVFDDSRHHRLAAQLLLSPDHDVTIVGSYDEAQKALTSHLDYDKARALFVEKYGDNEPYKSGGMPEEKRSERIAYYQDCQKRATTHPDFDIVLTDLLVPTSRQAQGHDGMEFVGKEMPLGTTIALLALTVGIRNVAVVTDMNHHNHPASATFDCFGDSKLDGVNILCTNSVGLVDIDEKSETLIDPEIFETDEGKEKYPFINPDGWGPRRGLIYGKNWKGILSRLLGPR
jgi:CheY-like chemotaxis protein